MFGNPLSNVLTVINNSSIDSGYYVAHVMKVGKKIPVHKGGEIIVENLKTSKHEILLRKLEYHGFRTNNLMWFKLYLNNTKEQFVNIRNKHSNMCKPNILGQKTRTTIVHFIHELDTNSVNGIMKQ